MSIIHLLAMQAAGQEIKTFYPKPSKEQHERELRRAQGLPVAESTAAPAPAPSQPAQPPQPDAPKPPPEPIKVMSVTQVPADANVIYRPEPQQPH
jgi:hypothetical protein